MYQSKRKIAPQIPVSDPKVTSDRVTQLIDNRPVSDVQHAIGYTDNKTIQKKANKMGLPDNLKSGIENLSGVDMSDTKVHYNSSKPAQLNAHAYAQGNQIHLASGQEKHLAHEAWHVVQQKQGRVKPTTEVAGAKVNDSASLEKEADMMGGKALQMKRIGSVPNQKNATTVSSKVAQRVLNIQNSTKSPFHNLKFDHFKSVKKRMPVSGNAWGIMKQMAGSPQNYQFKTWREAVSRAQKIYDYNPRSLRKWHHYITSGSNEQRKTIKQAGYATGDMFGIAAAMIVNPLFDVVISSGPGVGQPNHDPTDKAQMIKDFYLESGIEPWRIKVADSDNVRNSNNDMRDKIKETYQKDFGLNPSNNQINNHRSGGVSEGTYYLARNWSDGSKRKVRRAWKVNTNKDVAIANWLHTRNVPPQGQRIAILWSRFSGKKGDIHLEHDTSYEGMRQLIGWIAPHYSAVIIAGDPSATPASANKFAVMAQHAGINVHNLTGFWSHNTPQLRAWGGNTRIGQFKLYDYLDRHYAELKHLGARSGNLEVMAMMGHTTKYTEEPGSRGAERMESWHEAADGRTALGGKATGYERLLIHRPPTRSGQYLLANLHRYGDRPPWAVGRDLNRIKPAGISAYPKGFDKRDLQSICAYFGVPIPFIKTTKALTVAPPPRGIRRVAWSIKLLDLPTTGFSLSLLRHSYRKMALRYHPDRNANGAVMMRNINAARDTLLNLQAELAHDQREPQQIEQ